MVQLTSNFTSEAPLAPQVREAISIALQDGWADPKKSSRGAAKAAALRHSCLEEIAAHCHTQPSHLEVVGEPNLGYFLALAGFLTPQRQLVTSAVDVGKIRAIARSHRGEKYELTVDGMGRYNNLSEIASQQSLMVFQSCNGETGVRQESLASNSEFSQRGHTVVVDASRDIPASEILQGASAAIFDAAAWNGPAGIGLMYIAEPAKYRYPLPHIAPIRAPGSYSLPLLVGATVALTLFKQSQQSIIKLRSYAAHQLSAITGVTVVAEETGSHSRYLSFLIDGLSSEELLRTLQPLGVELDAGSACSPEDLTPSHVIAAMGLPTAGHMRITIHPESTRGEIDYMIAHIAKALSQLNS